MHSGTSTRLILLRHGETVWNLDDRYQGHLDSPLTPVGLAQAQALARRLATIQFGAFYGSDLGRAQATARCVTELIGREPVPDARLRERSLGCFQGLTRAEVKERFPAEHRRFKNAEADYAMPDGESPRQHLERVVACLDELAARHSGETIVAITHGGVVSAFLRHVLSLPLQAPRRFSRDNASWNEFVLEEDRWCLQTWGDVSHLDDSGMATD